MRVILSSVFLALVFCVSVFIPLAPAVQAQDTPLPGTRGSTPGSFADLVDKLLPAVVNISSTQTIDNPQDFPELPQFPPGSPFEDFFEEFMDRRGMGVPAVPETSLGSGFVIDAEKGLIITNNHVIRDAEEVRVTFHDDETLEADVIGRDEKTDLAVLKVDTEKKLTAVEFGDSSVLRVGDWVVAIGNPFGLGGTVTAGIVSARQRDINSGPYDDFIQTDASINRGNSGGPMFDLNGKVIGINTAIFSPSGGSVGIGFAIPSALAEPVIKQIIQYGRTRRGWLGVRIQQVTEEIAESLGLEKTEGALVASVNKDGPAQKAGLKAGDIILRFNDRPIHEMRELPRLVAETDIGSKASVEFWRDGKRKSSKVTIGELEKAEEDGLVASVPGEVPHGPESGTDIDRVGITVGSLSEAVREHYGIGQEVQGIIIRSVKDMSEAAKKGLLEGDVIVEINQQAVNDPEKARDLIDRAAKNGRSSVLLLVNREGDVRFVALKLGE
ncbi:MAG: DegQ family serine endoprotease [Alphaproteobacteria bacterium]|nr:DegQ family serine endoprotease [Alphaproteobacteria bacterium]